MVKEPPVSLAGAARDSYLRRLETRIDFLRDFVSGNEDGWGLAGKELEKVVEHLSRARAAVSAAQIRLVVDGRGPAEVVPQTATVIPFRSRITT